MRTDPNKPPTTAARRLASACAAALLALAVTAGCDQKMRYQPRYQPLDMSEFAPFGDSRTGRPIPDGTVARGQLYDDTLLHSGKAPDGTDSEQYPFDITREVLERGQERFNIYCSPCHGYRGDGNGMIVQRGMVRPPSYHEDRLTTAPPGYIVNVIGNGFGRMFKQGHIPAHDRWAIAAYVKTLQLSQDADPADLPAGAADARAAGGAQ